MADKTVQTDQFEFKAEVKQLLNILVHSLYTHKEIFVRELISNASDALDKIRFKSIKGTDVEDSDLPLEIRIEPDEKKNILTISDTGIGMTKEELINNVGTIAKSGTADFIKQITETKQDAGNLIGKFGVGFYSVFMAAKEVVITTKSFKEDEPAVRWKSDGLGTYEIQTLENEKVKRGTSVEIHLKDEEKEFTDKNRLEGIIQKHSNFITFPIFLEKERVNTITAIWREPKSSIKKEQYDEFYKFLTYDSEAPLETIHTSIDAPIQFNALLFIPPKSNEQFMFDRENYGLDLYVRRVLIQHQNKDLLPEYLSFVRGVVDSEDLPLNISRETLQENIIFTKISNSVTTQVLNHLQKMADNDKEKYQKFWKEHGRIFKLGYTDFQNQEKFTNLLRFNSSELKEENELTSLNDYVERLKKDQKEIYYITGNNRAAIELDPHLEIFRAKGLEVLYLFDPVDEFVISSLNKFKDYELKSVDQADLSKIENYENVEEKKEVEELSKEDNLHLSSLLTKIKEILGDKITEVKESKRLKDSPACLVNPDNTMSASMQKVMQMMNKDQSIPQKIMEINKEHKLIRNLLKVFKNDPNDEYIKNVVVQLYESSLLQEGYLTDPHTLVNHINSMLEKSSDWYTTAKNIK